jgi:urease beta subunit
VYGGYFEAELKVASSDPREQLVRISGEADLPIKVGSHYFPCPERLFSRHDDDEAKEGRR